jgi:hypothetical protein
MAAQIDILDFRQKIDDYKLAYIFANAIYFFNLLAQKCSPGITDIPSVFLLEFLKNGGDFLNGVSCKKNINSSFFSKINIL